MRREGVLRAGDGTELAWQSWQPGHPIADVVFVHGGGEHGGRYPHLVDRLIEADLAVHALDLRGHGRSGGRPGHVEAFEDYLDDLAAFRRHLGSESPQFLVGYSLGGLVCAAHALRAESPLAGLVLAAPALGVGEGVSPLVFRATRVLAAVAPRLGLFRMDPEAMMQDPRAVAAYRADPLVFHGRFDARLLAGFTTAMRELPHRLPTLSAPLLILHGEDDVTAHPAASRRALPAAGSVDKTLRTFPNTRHDLFNEPGHAAVCDATAEWIVTRSRAPQPAGHTGGET